MQLRISPWLSSLLCLLVVSCAGPALKDSPPGEATVVAEQAPAEEEDPQAPATQKGGRAQSAAPAMPESRTQDEDEQPPSAPLPLNTIKVVVRDSSGSPWDVNPTIRAAVEKVFKQCPGLTMTSTADNKDDALLHIQIAEYAAKVTADGVDWYLGIARGLIRLEAPGQDTLRLTFKGHCRMPRKPETPLEVSAALYDRNSLVEALITVMVEKAGPQCAIGLIAEDNQQAPLARAVLVKTGDPSVAPLIKILNDNGQDIGLRRAAVIVLGDINNPRAVKALIDTLNHSDFWVQYYAAVALIEHGDRQTISMLVGAMQSAAINEKERIHKVLVEATGANLGLDHGAWQQWWTVNKDRFP